MGSHFNWRSWFRRLVAIIPCVGQVEGLGADGNAGCGNNSNRAFECVDDVEREAEASDSDD